jgi:hypothetical protein
MTDAGQPICANCCARLTGEYCAQCGQHSADVRVSIGTLAHDFLSEHLGLDTKVARTLWRLVRFPGGLTVDYLAGRRNRYVLPLKLYLSASVLFFLLVAARGSDFLAVAKMTETDRASLDSLKTELTGPRADTLHARAPVDSQGRRAPASLKDVVVRRAEEKFKGQSAQQVGTFLNEGFKKYLPNMIFAMLPVFALILYLLYIRSGRFYAEHLIFAFHFHAFVFVAMALMTLAPKAVSQIFSIWIFVYLFLAMRRVYGESGLRTAAKFSATVAVYVVALLVASLTVMAGLVFAG